MFMLFGEITEIEEIQGRLRVVVYGKSFWADTYVEKGKFEMEKGDIALLRPHSIMAMETMELLKVLKKEEVWKDSPNMEDFE